MENPILLESRATVKMTTTTKCDGLLFFVFIVCLPLVVSGTSAGMPLLVCISIQHGLSVVKASNQFAV